MAKRTPNPITPEVARFWHPTLNGDKTPEDYTLGSGFKAWWQCELMHDFPTVIRDFGKGHRCPYCSGNKAWAGYNDLATMNPDIAEQWHRIKNSPLLPSQITAGSKKKIWWTGQCNHDFLATPNARTSGNTGCPYCAGQKILVGFNDLGTTHPEVSAQWHILLNGDKTPQNSTAGTNTKIWWTGTCGHDFLCAISEKVQANKGCPYCSGQRVLAGFNDLESNFPEIAKEWSPDNKKKPSEISHKSVTNVDWLCSQGHTFRIPVRARTQEGSGCLYCSGKRTLAGFNDFTIAFPHLKEEWDYELNGDVRPEIFPESYNAEKFWWKCKESGSHSYFSTIQAKTSKRGPVGCNVCCNFVILEGFNDLATLYPDIILEWDQKRNGKLSPNVVGRSFPEKVWWICKKGHSWNKSPKDRIGSNKSYSGCPECHSKSFASAAEREISGILESLGETVILNGRKFLAGVELDMYLPDRGIAIEYNGLYWHSIGKNGQHKRYHYDKWKMCQEKGVQLIQIWEDEWRFKREIVLRMILHKLGLSNEAAIKFPELGIESKPKVYARKTSVEILKIQETREFFDINHIQGFASGSHYIGLRNAEGELVSAVILKKEKFDTLNIVRYATDRNVVGGFTKILKYVERNLPVERFITFSDHCISDGALYENNGFHVDKELAPNYMYVVGKNRKHKFEYRIKKFKNDPKLKWSEGMTELQLAELNGLRRIYDAGKTRWVKYF